MKSVRILVVGHKIDIAELKESLPGNGFNIIKIQTQNEVLEFLQRRKVDIIVISARLDGGEDGLFLLKKLKNLYPFLKVIMLVDQRSVDMAVKSMKLGASDCVPEPVEIMRLSTSIKETCQIRHFEEKKITEIKPPSMSFEFVGESKQICKIKKLISIVGPSLSPVMILGETGTGKELVARAIHKASSRSHGPLITVNASALPESILASELFGYKKGAFTGAESNKMGLLDIADQGTFFVDEVGDMHLDAQAKLLRVVETGTFLRVGDTSERKVNVRFICATNKDLRHEIETRTFREDLFYRLNTFVIHIPPLRERKSDIPLLVDYFLRKISRKEEPPRLSPGAVDLLMTYSWPGNVRELANVLERGVLLLAKGESEIQADKLSIGAPAVKPVRTYVEGGLTGQGKILLFEAEREHIREVLRAARGNKAQAARALGISRTKLYSRLK